MRYIPPRKAMPSAEHPLKQKPIERYYYYEDNPDGRTSGGGYHFEESEAKYGEKKDATNK